MMDKIFSKKLWCGGTANGSDIAPEFGGNAAPNAHKGAEPWEPVSINIVGVGFTLFGMPAGLQYAFIGNSFTPDIMLEIGAGMSGNTLFFPTGTAFPFPAAGTTPAAFVDLHVCAQSGSPFQAHVTFYYTKNAI